MPLPRLQWGLPDAVPPNATGAWGCRAIVTQDGHVDLVPDRVDQQGSAVICDLLDSQFPPAKLTESLAALLRSGQMSTRRRERFELYESATITVAADTFASAGYCYVAAWTTTCASGSDRPDS
jgi:hypothetical protein